MFLHRPRLSIFGSVLVTLMACRSQDGLGESAAELVADDAAPTSQSSLAAPGGCAKYPVPYRPDGASAEPRARAELASFAPLATMTFSAVRGTLASVHALDTAIADCRNDHPLDAALEAFVAAHHDLFQVDPEEWEQSSLTCEGLSSDGMLVAWRRRLIGARAVSADILWFRVARDHDTVLVTATGGTYLPEAPGALAAQLLGCERFDPEQARENSLAASHPFRTFDYCAPTGDHLYSAAKPDQVALDAEPTWSWQEVGNTIVLSASVGGTLDVARENVTPELLRSDANCDGARIGFRIVADANTSELVASAPGIGCTVCAVSP